MKRYQTLAVFSFAGCILASCGSVNSDAAGGSVGSSSADGVAAQQSSQSADNAGSSDDSVNGHGPSSNALGMDLAQRLMLDLNSTFSASYDVDGCTGSVAGGYSVEDHQADYNVTINFNGTCTGKQKLTGSETIAGTWTTSDRTLQVTDSLTRTLADGDTVAISTLDTTVPYTFQLAATTVPSDGNVILTVVLNEHRVRSTSSGSAVFDHNITTDSNSTLTVTNSYDTTGLVPKPTSRSINGTINLHHNLAKFLAVNEFTAVTRDLTGACTCPSSGTLVQTVTTDNASGGYIRTYTFTGCGEATVVTTASTLSSAANGSATVTWDNCAE